MSTKVLNAALGGVAVALAAAALAVSLMHAGPQGIPGRQGTPGRQGPQGVPGIAQNLNGGYTSECYQPISRPDGTQVTYYYPCSPVPQNPADQ